MAKRAPCTTGPWTRGPRRKWSSTPWTWGINFFDTANGYSAGTSEEYLGRALKKNVSRAIHREIDGSLKRLGTDYLDLYIIHRFDYDTPIEETMEALNDLVKAGKVRALGASAMYGYQFYNMQLIARDHGWARFQAMENHYNLLYREDERELIPICKQMGVSLMPYSPLAAGHLTRRTWTADTLRSRTDRVAMGKYDRTEEEDLPIVARVARDEDARSRYLRTIQAKERDMEGMVDRALLARVTANLLDNSRKYGGRENVRVAISARAAGEQAELAFTDNGPGVPPEQLPRLFDPFYRGDAAHPKLLQTVWGVGYRLGRTAR